MDILQKLLILTLLQSILFAQTFKLQTVEKSNPAKGVLYKKFIDPQKPLSINLLEIDLSNPNLDLMAATAFDSVAGKPVIKTGQPFYYMFILQVCVKFHKLFSCESETVHIYASARIF